MRHRFAYRSLDIPTLGFQIICVLTILSLVTIAQQKSSSSIEGIVLDAATNLPIAGADVGTLLGSGSSRATTGADGHFLLTNLTSRRPKIAVGFRPLVGTKPHYASSAFQMELEPGENLKDVIVRVAPVSANNGILTGRVLNASGRPVTRANVSAYAYGYSRWTSIFESAEPSPRLQWLDQVGGQTDDRGEFRIANMPIGKSIVLISGCRPSSTPPLAIGEQSPCTGPYLGAVFYPVALDPSYAVPVETRPNQDTRLGDTVLPVPLGLVKMRVTNSAGVVQSAFRFTNSGYINPSPGLDQQPILINGRTVVPINFYGDYLIQSGLEHAMINISAGDVDIAVQLKPGSSGAPTTVPPGLIVSGHIRVESQISETGSSSPLSNLRVFFWDTSGTQNLLQSEIVSRDGTFKVTGANEGRYELAGFGPAAGNDTPEFLDYYILSAHQEERDLLKVPLNVSTEGAAMEMTLTIGGIIRGRVTDGSGQFVPNAVVALRPDDPLAERIDRSYTYRTERTDQRGVFEFRGVVPGEYHAFAWYLAEVTRPDTLSTSDPTGHHPSTFDSTIEDAAFRNREFMKPFEMWGKPVSVDKSGRTSVELRIIDHR